MKVESYNPQGFNFESGDCELNITDEKLMNAGMTYWDKEQNKYVQEYAVTTTIGEWNSTGYVCYIQLIIFNGDILLQNGADGNGKAIVPSIDATNFYTVFNDID
jgi:hypothetical protein